MKQRYDATSLTFTVLLYMFNCQSFNQFQSGIFICLDVCNWQLWNFIGDNTLTALRFDMWECSVLVIAGGMHAVHKHHCSQRWRCQLPRTSSARVQLAWSWWLPCGTLFKYLYIVIICRCTWGILFLTSKWLTDCLKMESLHCRKLTKCSN